MRLLSDTRGAARGLWRGRGTAGWAVLVLALGIGATAAVFGIVNDVLLRPLPYQSPNQLAVLWQKALARLVLRLFIRSADDERLLSTPPRTPRFAGSS